MAMKYQAWLACGLLTYCVLLAACNRRQPISKAMTSSADSPTAAATEIVDLSPPRDLPDTSRVRSAKELEQGTLVTLTAKDRPLSQLLADIHAQTGNRVRVVNEYRLDDETLLTKPVSLQLDQLPFWNVIDELCQTAELHFHSIDDSGLLLASTATDPANPRVHAAGPAVVRGAFQLLPVYDTFFNQAKITIRPEPWALATRLLPPKIEIIRAGMEPIHNQPVHDWASFHHSDFTGELLVRLDAELPSGGQFNGTPDFMKLAQVDLEAPVQVPLAWSSFTTPPVGTLTAKPVALAAGQVRIYRALDSHLPAEAGQLPPQADPVAVSLEAKGVAIDHSTIRLIDTAGNRHAAGPGSSNSQADDLQNIVIKVGRADVAGDLGDARLAVTPTGGEEQIYGPLRDLLERPAAAGLVNLHIWKTEELPRDDGSREWSIHMIIEPFEVPWSSFVLVDPVGQEIRPVSYGGGGEVVQFNFQTSRLKADREEYRLRLIAPAKAAEYVVHATFEQASASE